MSPRSGQAKLASLLLTRSGAVRAGITFRGKGAIKLITAIDLLYILIQEKLVQQNEVEVPGHGKVVLDPYLLEPRRKIAANAIRSILLGWHFVFLPSCLKQLYV
jgi:hypothetical protein